MVAGLTAAGLTSAAVLLVRLVTFWLSVPALNHMNSPQGG